MGMLFNSAATLKLLEKINSAFNKTSFPQNRHAALNRVNSALGNINNDHLYKVSSDLRIDLDTPSTRGNPNNWEKYLNLLEPNIYVTANMNYKEAILNALHNFLQDPNCQAIEFYAVEGGGYDLKISPIPTNTPYYGYILVQSLDLSQTTAYLRATEGRPAKGSRRRAASPPVRAPAAGRKSPEK